MKGFIFINDGKISRRTYWRWWLKLNAREASKTLGPSSLCNNILELFTLSENATLVDQSRDNGQSSLILVKVMLPEELFENLIQTS